MSLRHRQRRQARIAPPENPFANEAGTKLRDCALPGCVVPWLRGCGCQAELVQRLVQLTGYGVELIRFGGRPAEQLRVDRHALSPVFSAIDSLK